MFALREVKSLGPLPVLMKPCSKCKQLKNLAEFYVDKRRNRPTAQCKDCTKLVASSHKWRKANPEKEKASTRKSKLKCKYNITLEALEALWLTQNKSCAICKRPVSLDATHKASKPHIDHCHVTGVVRGLLCLTCNTGLGMFGDSLDLLSAASSYLREPHVTPVLQEFLSDSASVTAEKRTTLH